MRKKEFSDLTKLEDEVTILKKLDHPNIIKYIDYVNDSEYFHIITEYYGGGEVFDRLKIKGKYSELETASIIFDLLVAVQYCHLIGVVHRDIKLENIMYESENDDSKIKLVDFGLSKALTEELMHTQVGTTYYVAPEVLKGSYSAESDIWSIGVVAYILLCGYPPFRGTNDFMIFRKIEQGILTFPTEHWSDISLDCKNFIKGLLTYDPKDRLTAEQALKHDWFKIIYKRAAVELNSILDNPKITLKSKVNIDDIETLSRTGFSTLSNLVSQYFRQNRESSTIQDIYNYLVNQLGILVL